MTDTPEQIAGKLTKAQEEPAFPRTGEGVRAGDTHPRYDCPGMTLRDYFAGQALAGYFAAPHTPHQNADTQETAQYVYAMADAMLQVRAILRGDV